MRRIEALTGEGALESVSRSEAVLREVGSLLRGGRDDLADKVREALERIRAQEREIRTLKDKLASGQGVDLAAGAVEINGTKVIAARVEGADSGSLRTAVDQLKSRLGSAIIVLAARRIADQGGAGRWRHGRPQRRRIKAGELVGHGGRADRRQGRRPARFRAGRRQQARGARCGARRVSVTLARERLSA